MISMKKLYFIFFLTLFFTVGCGERTNEGEEPVEGDDGGTDVKVSPKIISDILQSIPSPLEISSLIKQINNEYSSSNMNPPANVTNYGTSFKQALNLGVYSTNLGFANLYGQNQDVLAFLDAVRKLADNLNIGQFFDYQTIKNLAQSSNNLDSLLKLTQQNFEQINLHLQDQKRESLSILILAGGWIEALYLGSLVYEKSPNPKLKEKIGEQKLALEQILLVLDIYKTKPNFAGLIADFKELQKIYTRVKITKQEGESKTVIKDGQITIEQGTISIVEMDDKDFVSLSSLLKSLRNKIVK